MSKRSNYQKPPPHIPSISSQNPNPQPSEERHPAANRKHSWLERFAVSFAFLAFCAAAYQGYISRDSEHRQLRAYVSLVPGDIDNFGIPDKQKFTFYRKNTGLTPAYDIVVSELGQSVITYGQPIPGNPSPSNENILRGTQLFSRGANCICT